MKTMIRHPIPLKVVLLLLGAVLLAVTTAPANAQPVQLDEAETAPSTLRRQAAELEREAAELNEAGRPDEARMLMRRVEELRSEFNRRSEADADRRQARALRPPRAVREPRLERPDRAEIEQRAHHLEIAIDNLHAAGLHEPAERLTEQLERMHRHLATMGPPRSDRPEGRDEAIEELRAQIGELHRTVRQLRAEIEELRREHR